MRRFWSSEFRVLRKMTSSPTSSSYSAYSSPFALSSSASTLTTSPAFAALPIAALRNKIIDKIQENRVTLIVGEPGCGNFYR